MPGTLARCIIPWTVSLLLHGLFAALLFVPRNAPSTLVRPNIELIDRELPRPEPPLPVAPPPAPAPEIVAPRAAAEARLPDRPARQRAAPPDEAPLAGDPTAEEPPAADTGPQTFGITLEGETLAAAGEGVALPSGQTLRADPATTRVGKGERDGARPGLDGDNALGGAAPLATVTQMPRVLRRVQANYPERIKALGIEGRVILELRIDETGQVTEATLIEGLHEVLDQSALDAARAMAFSPARIGQIAVATRIRYTFTFILD